MERTVKKRVQRIRAASARGQTLIEFALLLPVMVSLALMTLDFGRLFYYDVQFQNAVHEAARVAAKNPSVSTATLQTIIQSEGGFPSGSVSNVSLNQIQGQMSSTGVKIEQVTATYSFTFITPWFQAMDGVSNPLTVRTYVATEASPSSMA